MSKNKSSVSKAHSYKEIGEYWDKHDIAEHWEETKPAEFEADIKSCRRPPPLDDGAAPLTKTYGVNKASVLK